MKISEIFYQLIDPRDRQMVAVLTVCVAAMVIAAGMNVLIDAGALLHDLACPDHGWLRR